LFDEIPDTFPGAYSTNNQPAIHHPALPQLSVIICEYYDDWLQALLMLVGTIAAACAYEPGDGKVYYSRYFLGFLPKIC
jgi:hypothetical protein